jgi:hypothetical protein
MFLKIGLKLKLVKLQHMNAMKTCALLLPFQVLLMVYCFVLGMQTQSKEINVPPVTQIKGFFAAALQIYLQLLSIINRHKNY